ncbi:hypothetical protein [Caviibacter abscessus]|uniref:hypothetical protein n=1 Tax=Caviibacter abscessus TaxID=1766719 RepID=UPI00082E449A|nr:hypothetical protein [Caviibacter abscessus]
MLSLELTEKELEQANYNPEAIKNILVSRAIYNESYNYEFTEEQLEEIKYIEQNEAVRLYMRKTVEPRLLVTETTIIDKYNENKSYFESQNISFSKAHDIIKNQLTQEINFGLEQDLVYNLVHNMEESVTLSKQDLVFTKGNPDLIKSILLQNLLKQEAIKNTFFEDNADELETIKKEIRLKYYADILCSKDVKITEEEVSKYYVDHTKDFENMDIQYAYSQISTFLFQTKVNENMSKYIKEITDKYEIDKKIEKYKKDDGAVIN